MASALSQAPPIEQFVYGTSLRERQQQAHLLDTWIRSGLWHSHQMASASSQALPIEQFVCGTSLREGQRQTHLWDIRIQLRLWHSRQMASASSQVRTIEQFVCGMSLRERQQRAHLLDTSVQSGLWYSRQMVSALSHQDIRILNATTGNTETTRHVDFTDHSVINEEGWICGSEGELLMWIPPPHRA